MAAEAVREGVGAFNDTPFEVFGLFVDGATGELKHFMRWWSFHQVGFEHDPYIPLDAPTGKANRGWNTFLRIPGGEWHSISMYDTDLELQAYANKLARRRLGYGD